MEPAPGWEPLRRPRRPGGEPSAFARLARTHAFGVAGDTLITLALADSIFFGISPTDARPRVLLYLLLTMAPFAVVAPLLGPWIDSSQGGRRLMLMVAAAGRAVVCLLLIDDIESLLLFPEAFAALVLAKSHSVARSALVATVVNSHDELVEANSKLSLVSGLVGFAVGLPGVLILWLGGAPWVLGFGVAVFTAGAVAASRLPKGAVARHPATPLERSELRSAGIVLAVSAMGALRGIVGFFTFFVAFFLRSDEAPTWWFGLVIAASAGAGLAGAAVAPWLRRHTREEWMLVGQLAAVTGVALWAATAANRVAVLVTAAVVALAAAAGKTAFDAIVQRDAPDANQGRSFARFETRFQLLWVIGAIVPVLIPLPARAGLVLLGAAAGFAAVSYAVGLRAADRRPRPGGSPA